MGECQKAARNSGKRAGSLWFQTQGERWGDSKGREFRARLSSILQAANQIGGGATVSKTELVIWNFEFIEKGLV